MTLLRSLSVAALLAAGALVVAAPTALARVVCDDWGHCWHVHGRLHAYYPGGGWTYQPYPPYSPYQYQWGWRQNGDVYGGWGEQEGRGYWSGHGEED
jgi:hypothetical protein